MAKEEELGKKENELSISSEGPPSTFKGERDGRGGLEKKSVVKGGPEFILEEYGSGGCSGRERGSRWVVMVRGEKTKHGSGHFAPSPSLTAPSCLEGWKAARKSPPTVPHN